MQKTSGALYPARDQLAANDKNYRPDIDGLRAIAVLLVVFFHAGFAELSGGFVGVDIFFVISGYLITGIIERELDGGHFSFADFYARRIKRICPALFVVLGLSAVAGFLLLIPADLKGLGTSIDSSVLFYANWHFYSQVGYFDGPAIEKPLLHTWSLAVEEQFYLIWPITLFCLYRAFGRKALPNFILALLCLSLVASQLVLRHNQVQVFYLLPYRAWELLLGAYLAVAPLPALARNAASVLGLAGFGTIAYAAVTFTAKTPFPGANALLPCLGAAMLIAAGGRHNSLSRRVLGLGPLRFVGKISYSLYLIHWPIFSFANIILDHTPSVETRLAIMVASVILAALSWRFVETPARRATLRFSVIAPAVASAAALLALCGIAYHATNGLPFRVPSSVQIADAARQIGGKKRQRADCRNDAKPPLPGPVCPIGAAAPDLQYDFVIWGDSHARQLASAFTDQARERGLAGIVLSSGACPPFINENRLYSVCADANLKIATWIKTQAKLKTVFLAGAWTTYARDGLLTVADEDEATTDKISLEVKPTGQAGLRDTLRFLRSLHIPMVILDDTPFFPRNVPSCVARARMFGRSDEHCFVLARRDFDGNSEQASFILTGIRRRYDIPLVSTAHAFCDRDFCRAERDGVIFYRDHNHLNTTGARYLGSQLDIPWPRSVSRSGNTASLP